MQHRVRSVFLNCGGILLFFQSCCHDGASEAIQRSNRVACKRASLEYQKMVIESHTSPKALNRKNMAIKLVGKIVLVTRGNRIGLAPQKRLSPRQDSFLLRVAGGRRSKRVSRRSPATQRQSGLTLPKLTIWTERSNKAKRRKGASIFSLPMLMWVAPPPQWVRSPKKSSISR
jgi:hypothetical protein